MTFQMSKEQMLDELQYLRTASRWELNELGITERAKEERIKTREKRLSKVI